MEHTPVPSKKPKKQPSHLDPTTEEGRSAAEIFQQTKELLETTKRGLSDIQSDDPRNRVPGIHNVAVFGRSVTQGLQRLKHVAPGFEEWYTAKGLDKEPLLIFFNKVRNAILKEANLDVGFVLQIDSWNTDVPSIQGPPPPGAAGFFMAEARTGGSGWLVPLPDGQQEKYYAALSPAFQGNVTLHFPNPPTEHAGKPITDTSVAGLAQLYVGFLEELVNEAEGQFMPPSRPAPE
jgi:hypothetical protein